MLLVNASNLYVGGGVQVGLSVIEEFSRLDVEFIAVVSPPVYDQLTQQAKKNSIIIEKTPSGILNFESRAKLDEIVEHYKIKDVFTVFGPSYWNPKVKSHMVGFALPWLIYDTKKIYAKLTGREKIKKQILRFLQPYFFKKNATKIVVETDDVRLKVINLLGMGPEKVLTIPNTVSSNFLNPNLYDYSIANSLPVKKEDDIWLLTVAHNYPHKNIEIIYELLELLPEKYKFILTLDDSFLAPLSGKHKERIILTGKVTNAQCPPLYQQCNGMFLPTLLECFSAAYVEAAYMNKPVFTSDRDFAKAVCKNNAFYFDPLNSRDIANKLEYAFAKPDLINSYCLAAKEAARKLPDAEKRAKLYLSAIYAE